MEVSQVIIVLIALVAANLPFAIERIFFIVQPSSGQKNVAWRLFELIVLYFVVGLIAWLLERRLGTPHVQTWEFYPITVCLFLVFAYPGFVVKYLWKAKGR